MGAVGDTKIVRGKNDSIITTFFCTTTLLMMLLVLLMRKESYAVLMAGLTSPNVDSAGFSVLADVVSGQWVSASGKGILMFSCLVLGCGYFPLRWISKCLQEWDYFGSNFH